MPLLDESWERQLKNRFPKISGGLFPELLTGEARERKMGGDSDRPGKEGGWQRCSLRN